MTAVRHNPTGPLSVVLAVALSYLVIVPIVFMILDGLRVHPRDRTRLGEEPGTFVLQYVRDVFASDLSSVVFWNPLVRTLAVAVPMTILALTLAFLCAWIVMRTRIPGKRWLSTGLVIPYIFPSWTFAIAWLTVFKNRRIAGYPGFAETFGFNPPDWLAYGALPITLSLAFHLFPLGFLLFANALGNIGSELEEAGQVVGASRRTILRKILVPLMLPAVMSTILLTLAKGIGTFGVPYILGSPTGYRVLSTALFANFSLGRPGGAAVIATAMVVMGGIIVAVDTYVVREYRRFVTVGGKGGMRRPASLGRWQPAANSFVYGVFLISVVAPILVLVLSTVTRQQGLLSADNFTLAFWVGQELPARDLGLGGLLVNPNIPGIAWNSFRIAAIAALVCGIAGMAIGYVVTRRPNARLSPLLRQLSFVPYLVPAIALAAAFISLFAVRRGPVPGLYGTGVLLIIVMIVAYLPFGSRSGISSMSQMGIEGEEAAMVAGARWTRRMRSIVLPAQRNAIIAAVLLPFISGMKELSLVVMLVTPGTELMSTWIVRMLDEAQVQLANGATLIVILIIVVTMTILQRVTRVSLGASVGGG